MDEAGQDILRKREQVERVEADVAHSKKMMGEHRKAIKTREDREKVEKILDPVFEGLQVAHKNQQVGQKGQQLTPLEDGTFVLSLRPNMSPNSLELTQLTQETDHIGYFNYDIMERRAIIYFDPETNKPIEVDVYDIDGMKQDKASEADSHRYRQDNDVGQLLAGGPETAQEVADYLQPMLEPLQETNQPSST